MTIFLNSLKNGDFLTQKLRKKQKELYMFEEKKNVMAHFPLQIPVNYTKINKYDGFQGQNPWKIMFIGKNGGSFLAVMVVI